MLPDVHLHGSRETHDHHSKLWYVGARQGWATPALLAKTYGNARTSWRSQASGQLGPALPVPEVPTPGCPLPHTDGFFNGKSSTGSAKPFVMTPCGGHLEQNRQAWHTTMSRIGKLARRGPFPGPRARLRA